MAKEIERKFLVTDGSWRAAALSQTTILQAYLCALDDRSLRVRILGGNRAALTLKIGGSALARDEFEYAIPLADAREMVGLAVGHVLEKIRYTVEYRGYLWEIDEFGGIYAGLTVAEVEIGEENEMPPLPPWTGLEVTADRRYSNQMLAATDLSRELCHGLAP